MPANVWILNLVVLGAVLEAGLGRRKIGWFRLVRPLLTAILICPLFLDSVPTNSHDVALQAAGIGVGVLLGLGVPIMSICARQKACEQPIRLPRGARVRRSPRHRLTP